MASRKSRKKSPLQGDKKDDKECLAYKVLSMEKTKQLMEIDNADDLQIKIAHVMDLTDNQVDLKEASVLDYYVSGFWWGKEQNFTAEQISALFTVLKTLLDNIKEKNMSLVENLKEFKKMLAGIGTDLEVSSGSLSCFNVSQAKNISEYFHISLFQHYTMYEFLFTNQRDEEVIGTDLAVETAEPADMPWPPPLDEGVSEEIHTLYIATPPPTPTPQEEEGQGDQEQGVLCGENGEEIEQPSDREVDLLAQLSTKEVEKIMRSVFDEVLGGLQADVAHKLREKENGFINRINKIHNIAQS